MFDFIIFRTYRMELPAHAVALIDWIMLLFCFWLYWKVFSEAIEPQRVGSLKMHMLANFYRFVQVMANTNEKGRVKAVRNPGW